MTASQKTGHHDGLCKTRGVVLPVGGPYFFLFSVAPQLPAAPALPVPASIWQERGKNAAARFVMRAPARGNWYRP
jgi:hypothetical protein